jgi:hypothetical protein
MQMLKIVVFALLVNILLGGLFVFFNYSIYYDINSEVPTVSALHWTPWIISAPHYDLPINENQKVDMVTRIYSYFNYPFWMFFVLMFTNLLFIAWIAKKKSN